MWASALTILECPKVGEEENNGIVFVCLLLLLTEQKWERLDYLLVPTAFFLHQYKYYLEVTLPSLAWEIPELIIFLLFRKIVKIKQ